MPRPERASESWTHDDYIIRFEEAYPSAFSISTPQMSRTLLLLLVLWPLAAAAQLTPGDIALVGFRADNPDEFAFVALVPVAGGTQISFTDNGWQASDSFRANEGTFVYTAPSTGLAPGVVVVVTEPAGPAFAASGDQILAYTGSDAAPSFVYALNVEGDAEWQPDAISSNTSALPTGLANGTTAVAVAELDNVAYTGPTSGTKAELLTAIGTPSNWTGSDEDRPPFPASFTVTGDGGNLAPSFTAVLTDRDVVADIAFTFDYDAADADGDALTFALEDGPAGALIAPSTGILTWTPSQAQANQSFEVVVSVTDGQATATTTAALAVLAEAPEQGPSFVSPTYGAVLGVGETLLLDYDAVDPEGGPVRYVIASGPPGVPAPSVNATTGVLTWTAPAEPSVYTFVVGVTDQSGASAQVELFIAVQDTLFPDLTGEPLRAAVRGAYPASTLGYGPARDTLYARVSSFPGDQLCGVYTGYCITLEAGRDASTDAFNKGINAEHTWPQSQGAADEPQRSDMHILYPARDNVNSSRGNSPYGEVDDVQTETWYRGAESQTTPPPLAERDEWSERGPVDFEPREAVKGDVARAVLYFATIYQTAANASFLAENIEAVLTWNGSDPAGPEEAVRSGLIERYQGNVNPFVLDPDLARRIYLPGSVATDDDPTRAFSVSVWPNPVVSSATFSIQTAEPTDLEVVVYDALGRQVASTQAVLGSGTVQVPLDLSLLPAGLYIARVTGSDAVAVQRLTVVR